MFLSWKPALGAVQHVTGGDTDPIGVQCTNRPTLGSHSACLSMRSFRYATRCPRYRSRFCSQQAEHDGLEKRNGKGFKSSEMTNITRASVLTRAKSFGRAAHPLVQGSASSDTTFVSSTTDTAAGSIKGARLTPRTAQRQLQVHFIIRSKNRAGNLHEIPGTRLGPDSLAENQPDYLFHRAVVLRCAHALTHLYSVVERADRDARHSCIFRWSRSAKLCHDCDAS